MGCGPSSPGTVRNDTRPLDVPEWRREPRVHENGTQQPDHNNNAFKPKESIKIPTDPSQQNDIFSSIEANSIPKQESNVRPSLQTNNTHRQDESPRETVKQVGRRYKKPMHLTVEDTFSEGKRKLIPDYSVMKRIDVHALNTPASLKDNPEELVEHLIRPCTNELEKVRVIFRWILENVEYDRDNFNRGTLSRVETEPEDVIRNGKTVCHGYSVTFVYMCKLADIECEYLHGACKAFAANYVPGYRFPVPLHQSRTAHAWNKVKIYGNWYLCDCTWADMEYDVNAVADMDERLQQGVSEVYFLADPELLLGSHLPIADFKDGTTDIESQFVKTPVRDMQAWSQTMAHGVGRYLFNMSLLSPDKAVVKADTENRALIRLKSPHPMKFWSKLVHKKSNKATSGEHVIISVLDDIVTIDIFLPNPGEYEFALHCRPLHSDDQLQRGFSVLHCLIVSKSQTKNVPIAGYHHWGQSPLFLANGFEVISHESPIIDVVEGSVDIVVALPDADNRSTEMLYALKNQTNEQPREDKYVYSERRGDTAIFHITLPKKGIFTLDLMVKVGENQSYTYEAGYLLRCSRGAKETGPCIDFGGTLAGPNDKFSGEMGIKFHGEIVSTITAKQGAGSISFITPNSIDIKASLGGNALQDVDGDVMFTDRSNYHGYWLNTIHLRFLKIGFYKINLMAKQKLSGHYEYIGYWVVDVQGVYKGPLFPKHGSAWGPNDIFEDCGFKVVGNNSNYIKAVDGKCTLEIANAHDYPMSYHVKRNRENIDHKYTYKETKFRESVVYHFRLPGKDCYKLEIFVAKNGSNTYEYIGTWLIESECSYTGELFPPTRNWGPSVKFHEMGLSVVAPQRTTLDAPGGKCQLVLKEGSNAIAMATQSLKRDEKKYKKEHVQVDRSSPGLLKYDINVPDTGYYLLVMFAGHTAHGADFIGSWLVDSH